MSLNVRFCFVVSLSLTLGQQAARQPGGAGPLVENCLLLTCERIDTDQLLASPPLLTDGSGLPGNGQRSTTPGDGKLKTQRTAGTGYVITYGCGSSLCFPTPRVCAVLRRRGKARTWAGEAPRSAVWPRARRTVRCLRAHQRQLCQDGKCCWYRWRVSAKTVGPVSSSPFFRFG